MREWRPTYLRISGTLWILATKATYDLARHPIVSLTIILDTHGPLGISRDTTTLVCRYAAPWGDWVLEAAQIGGKPVKNLQLDYINVVIKVENPQ